MSIIIDQTVIHIKLTDAGRDLLSRGELNFSQFAVGDSEIDYNFLRENTNVNPEDSAILRPVDNDPDIVSFITRRDAVPPLNNLITPIENVESTVSNTVEPKGIFDTTTNQYFDDTLHVKQASAAVNISGVTGSGNTVLNIIQDSSYGNNINEPEVGDYLFIKWSNPDYTGNINTSLNGSNEIVQLTYKIITIVSGNLADNNLVVNVDRNLPDFSGYIGSGSSRIFVYPNNNDRNTLGDAIQTYYGSPFVSDFVTESVLTFQENYDTPTIEVPVWNMTIIHSREIEGVQSTSQKFSELPSRNFVGFVQYIERLEPTVENIGLIHYSNLSPSNNYGEGFWTNENIPNRLPRLTIPHVMWYNNTLATGVLELSADFSSLTGFTGLNIDYLDLIDNGIEPRVVGKIFPDLKIFIIEDQELLAALTYKSNRNWTLPQSSAGFNIEQC